MRPIRHASALLAALAALVLAAGAGAAPPEIAARQAEAQRVLADIEEIDRELGTVIEGYNGATVELRRLERELEDSRARLKTARANYRKAEARLQERLVAIYTSGQASPLDVLLGASSLTDLIDRVDSVERITTQDAEIAAEVRAYRDEVRERQARLAAARSEQEEVVAERAARRETIERRLEERRTLYASIEDEIADLEAAERQRQRRLAAEAEAQLEAERRAAAAQEGEPEPDPEPAPAAPSPPPAPAPPPATPAPAPPGSSRGARAAQIALRYLGVPYRWGGASPSTGFDCSGLVMYVYRQVGVSLPHHAASQYRYGTAVSRSQLQPGDLVFFHGLGHNGIYIGGGNFVHAPQTGDVVKISPLAGWYTSRWVGARRL